MCLEYALGRVSVSAIKSKFPKPFFDQSTRDGYAIHQPSDSESGENTFKLVAEIAAGSQAPVAVQPGEAVRIMTGALIPSGCSRVVPFELCREENGQVEIPVQVLDSPDIYIRHRGKDLDVGAVIVEQGRQLSADHLMLLAENRATEVEVYRKPGVVVLCTGSELVDLGQDVRPGQKVSGNGVLLKALVSESDGVCLGVALATDTHAEIIAQLQGLLELKPDLIVTTGGMGPGKFDLMEQVFSSLDGTVLYNSLQVRPGKATLYGQLAGIPLFALPGPPPAVRLLFHELVVPALARLQGRNTPLPPLIEAQLLEPIPAGKSQHLSLKGGVAGVEAGNFFVRSAGRRDTVNAILHLDRGETSFAQGELISVRLARSVLIRDADSSGTRM